MKVRELMTKKVSSCRATDACSEAVKIMWECDCGAVPVVGDDDRLVGIITDRDVCMATWLRDSLPRDIPVSAIMSRELCVCSPSDRIDSAEQLMRTRQIRRLPVVDTDQRLVGILSLADIVREAGGDGGRKRVVADEITATLADICQPRPASSISA
jgi:CBS domain-containing protein